MGEVCRLILVLICACACACVRACSCVAVRIPGASQAKMKEIKAAAEANGLKVGSNGLKVGDAKKA